ncbi:hypothetical protein L2E82_11825 [Cichorium intybus]|uniref:Uncharacterized protein n=1 Tax=Cichorium intybus TaxID=13427 RepID=A0ACB9GE51_CICIN|nr:hypothetical protein L2E82_11825 [Cichorium intybus]
MCSADPHSKGLKRKIGCLDALTQTDQKKKIDQDFERGEMIGNRKFGSTVKCWSKHFSGHPDIVTLKVVYKDAKSFHLVIELCSGGPLLDQRWSLKRILHEER